MPDSIVQWLRQLGLGSYDETFQENAIDFRSLPELTKLREDDLQELGLKLGHWRILLRTIAELTDRIGASYDITSTHDSHPDRDPSGCLGTTSLGTTSLGTASRGTQTGHDAVCRHCRFKTALTEKLDAEEAHDLLYGATQRMFEAVEKYQGARCAGLWEMVQLDTV
ncbi:MAG: SAM domain-containing protein [Arenicellales bacterium]